jgi:DNA-binding NarL/FixJ family response regulator
LLDSLVTSYSSERIILHTTKENKHINYYNSVLGICHFVYAEDSVDLIKRGVEKILAGVNGLIPDNYSGILTNRECEVLRLIALGKTSKEIAEQLCISKNTVDTHRNKMLQKLNIANSASLVQFAYNTGLI